ncbi:MAG: YciI family protein [Gaiellaceae bacterium]
MQYLAMIYGDAGRWEALSDEERTATYARYTAFAEEAGAAGVLVDGAELKATASATTVRVRDGETLVTDGPFVEAKEALGGYFLLERASIDDAVDWAARIPGADHGAIEVRPCYVDESEEAVT